MFPSVFCQYPSALSPAQGYQELGNRGVSEIKHGYKQHLLYPAQKLLTSCISRNRFCL